MVLPIRQHNNWYAQLELSEHPSFFEIIVKLNEFHDMKQLEPGILNTPHYYQNGPAAVNFGAIGSTIGHEIGHAFAEDHMLKDFAGEEEEEYDCIRDSEADSGECPPSPSRPESYELYGARLPIKTRKIIKKKQQCLIKHYSRYCINGNTTCTGGEQTLAENEADILGLKTALNGYKLWTELAGQRLDSVMRNRKISDEQLFFISYAKQWCTKIDPETAENLLRHDIHSLSKFRVLGPLSQMKEFKDAFQCHDGKAHNNDWCNYWY